MIPEFELLIDGKLKNDFTRINTQFAAIRSESIDLQTQINAFENVPAYYKTNVLNYAGEGDTIYDGVTSANSAIVAALADMPSGGTLYFPYLGTGTYLLTDDIDFTSYPDITIEFEANSKLNISDNKTLTGNNTKICAGLHQIFQLNSGSIIDGTWNIKEVNVLWFISDITIDCTEEVQNAITFIETQVFKLADYKLCNAYTLYFPKNNYIVNGAIIQYPFIIKGDGRNATFIISDDNTPTFIINGMLVTDKYEMDSKTTFRHLSICGSNDDINTDQHGIYAEYISGRILRIELDWCTIFNMSGHGIYSETAVSNRIHNCIIAKNKLDGIHFTGVFNTDFHIHECVIRENMRGIVISPEAGQYFTSGWIYNNLIESNYYGSGQLGSLTRPAVGISLLRCQRMRVYSNYFEDNLNDIYWEDNVSYCVFRDNHHNNGNEVPGYFPGIGGTLRKVGAYYNDGGINCVGNTIKENDIYKPSKPAGTADADWNILGFGSEYEHLPLGMGVLGNCIENYTTNSGTGDIEDITYPADPNYFIYFRGLRTESGNYKKKEKAYEFYREALSTIKDKAQYRYFESVSASSPGSDYFVYPVALTGDNKRSLTLAQRNVDGTKTDIKDFMYLTSNGVLYPTTGYTIYASDFTIKKVMYKDSAPATGTWAAGDRIWKSTPVVGQPIGWICTVAGTPGTWVALANL